MIEDDITLSRRGGVWTIQRGARFGTIHKRSPFARILDALVDGMLINDPAKRAAPDDGPPAASATGKREPVTQGCDDASTDTVGDAGGDPDGVRRGSHRHD